VQPDGAIACVIYAANGTEDGRGSIRGQLAECRAAIAARQRRAMRLAPTAPRRPGREGRAAKSHELCRLRLAVYFLLKVN
jgi:hypothetical protein